MKPIALTIAGSDPSGGAGIQADLKTFHQFGVYGLSVVTLLTIQNTQHLLTVKVLESDFVLRQFDFLLNDFSPQAVKTGALGSAEIIEGLAERVSRFSFPLVVDPVIMSRQGMRLVDTDGEALFVQKLLPLTTLVTPNLHEAEWLSKRKIDSESSLVDAAKAIVQLGAKAVLIKGGHWGDGVRAGEAKDLLYENGLSHTFSAKWIETPHTHGTGCTYSAAITAALSQGVALTDAVKVAKRYMTQAIATAPGLGQGQGPVNHHAQFQ